MECSDRVWHLEVTRRIHSMGKWDEQDSEHLGIPVVKWGSRDIMKIVKQIGSTSLNLTSAS